jgi:hypothetical protein
MVAMAPPRMAVRLNPSESVKIPASGETKDVMPIDNDPTKAVNDKYNIRYNKVN